MESKTIGLIFASLVTMVIIVAAAFVLMGDGNEPSDTPEQNQTPETNPIDIYIGDLPIGSTMTFETSGTYTYGSYVYTLSGTEEYKVISKTSASISFEVNGTIYASYGGQKITFSKSNGDIKTWDLTDKHEPSEKGVLETSFGVVNVKKVVWNLPSKVGDIKITDLGSSQFWSESGYGLKQMMNYTSNTGESVKSTKTLIDIEVKE